MPTVAAAINSFIVSQDIVDKTCRIVRFGALTGTSINELALNVPHGPPCLCLLFALVMDDCSVA